MRKHRFLLLIALLSALSLIAAACGGDDDGDGDTADGGGEDISCTWSIGTMGALSGDFASLGAPIRDGIKYAIDPANEAGEVPCELSLVEEDSQGSPDQAPALAQSLIETEDLVAVSGPYFSGETLAVGEIFSSAGVAFSGTGTNETIDEQGYTTWFRSVAPDNIQGEVAADYIAEALGGGTVAVIHDNQDYSKGLADSVVKNLDGAEGPFVINPEETDYSSVVQQVNAANPDVVFYGGYTPQAGPLLAQLTQGGVDAQFLSDDGAKDPSFGELAGDSAQGAQVTCPCTDPTKQESAASFVDGMRSEYGEDAPGTFDMYDVTNIIIEALMELNGDEDIEEVRAHVVEYFQNAEGIEGVAKSYSWEESGEFVGGPEDIWVYEWDDAEGNFVSLGPAAELLGQ
ncbi:MAG: branched-chain amino acid ABC transporter substrate-binding protein [Actinomycetota bacterium]